MKKDVLLALISALTLVFSSAWAEPLRVLVSIVPQLESVRTIGGDTILAEAVVLPGASPENYVLTASRMVSFSRAKVLFTIGAPIETALLPKLKASFPHLKVVDCRPGMTFRHMEAHHHDGEDDGEDDGVDDEHSHEHEHDGIDPHVWLSVSNMKQHASNVTRTLAVLCPDNAPALNTRLHEYLTRLDALNARIRKRLMPFNGKAVLVFHPAFGYLLDEAGIRQLAVEPNGHDPGAHHLAELRQDAAAASVAVLFIQPQFNRRNAAVAAQFLHCRVAVLDPLPSHYITGIDTLANAIADALEAAK